MADKFRIDIVDPFNNITPKTPAFNPFGLVKPKKQVNMLEQLAQRSPREKATELLSKEKKKRSVRDIVADALFAASKGITAQTGISPTPGTAVGAGVLKGLMGVSSLFERDAALKKEQAKLTEKETALQKDLEMRKELARYKQGLKPTPEQKAEEARLTAEARLPSKKKAFEFATEEINKRNNARLTAARNVGLNENQAAALLLKAEESAKGDFNFISTFQIPDPIARAQAQQDMIDKKYAALITAGRRVARGGTLPSRNIPAPTVKRPTAVDIDVSGL